MQSSSDTNGRVAQREAIWKSNEDGYREMLEVTLMPSNKPVTRGRAGVTYYTARSEVLIMAAVHVQL